MHQPVLRFDDRQTHRVGETREQALARLDDALARTHIVGRTPMCLPATCREQRLFRRADLDTALIERERTVLFNQTGLALEVAAQAWSRTHFAPSAFSKTSIHESTGWLELARRRAPTHSIWEFGVCTIRFAWIRSRRRPDSRPQ